MRPTLIELLFREQKIGYVLADKYFNVLEQGGDATLFEPAIGESLRLFDAIPELEGCEDVLQDVIEGILPRFTLENINRTLQTGDTHYLNFIILPFQFDDKVAPLLLIILSDTTALSQSQHVLTQQHNELRLLKRSLDDTNQRLEFILQRYVPREVGKALMENRILPELGGEVRRITVLFADLRNYTSISEKLTPSETMDMLHICLDIASTAIAEAGGVVINYMGDGVMAIFNAPDEQLDHAKRAVRAGLNMQAMALQYQKSQSGHSNPTLHFGVGINTGLALVGNIGAQWHYQYTAVGDTINVASRICSHARPNEVLIGSNTYHHIHSSVVAYPLPPMKFKGKSEEITVYQVFSLDDNALQMQFS